MYCSNCRVKVIDTKGICPLCLSPLEGEKSRAGMFPKYIEEKKQTNDKNDKRTLSFGIFKGSCLMLAAVIISTVKIPVTGISDMTSFISGMSSYSAIPIAIGGFVAAWAIAAYVRVKTSVHKRMFI